MDWRLIARKVVLLSDTIIRDLLFYHACFPITGVRCNEAHVSGSNT